MTYVLILLGLIFIAIVLAVILAKRNEHAIAKEFYVTLIKVLRGQPILAAFVGIVFIFVIGGSSGVLVSKLISGAEPGMTYALTFLGALLIFVLLAVVLNKSDTGQQRPDQSGESLRVISDPRIVALSDAIDQLKTIVEARWVKSDLHFTLSFTEVEGDPLRAKASLVASFRIINITDNSVSFPFFTEVEVSPSAPATLSGHLSVRNTVSRDLIQDLDIKLHQVDHLAIRRYQPTARTVLTPRSEYLFEWTINEWEVLLPYSEYWTSAHPVLNIQVEIKCHDPDLRSSAIVYRPPEQGTNGAPIGGGSASTWTANGVFLPYQGIFVKVFRRQRGQQ